MRCVGATTLDEYRKRIEKDPALERRFQPVFVGEPSLEHTIAILRGLKERYEVHHGVRITDGAIIAAAYATGVVPVNLPPITGPVPALGMGDVHLDTNAEGLGPGLPLKAILNASRICCGICSVSVMVKAALVMSLNIFSCGISCNAPMPLVLRGAAPPIRMSGLRAS